MQGIGTTWTFKPAKTTWTYTTIVRTTIVNAAVVCWFRERDLSSVYTRKERTWRMGSDYLSNDNTTHEKVAQKRKSNQILQIQ